MTDKEELLNTTSLNRSFIQLISTADDYGFQSIIEKFLPLLIRSIENQTDDFRKKALEIFLHVNKRIKSRPEIQIPVQSLLEIFTTTTNCSPFASNFSIMYIKLGYMRLSVDVQAKLVPLLLQALKERSIPHQELLMGLVVYGIQNLRLIPNDNVNKTKYGLVDQPTIRHTFLTFLLNVLLMPYKFEDTKTNVSAPFTVLRTPRNSQPLQQQSTTVEQPSTEMDLSEDILGTAGEDQTKDIVKEPYPCLNEQLYKRITDAIQTTDLVVVEKLKAGILKFLMSNVYLEDEMAFHFVLATADSRYTVVLAAEHDIKRINVAIDWNAKQHVQKLFEFFLGSAKTMKNPQPNDMNRHPSNTRLRLKLFPYLLRSRAASSLFPHAIQIVYESLFGTSTNARIKYYALQFLQNILQNAEQESLSSVSKLILYALEKLLNTEVAKTPDSSRLRSLSYVLIGKLAYRLPQLLCNEIRLTQLFFQALQTEDNECCLHIQEALSMLSYSQKQTNVANKHILQQLLTEQVNLANYPQCRQAAVNYVQNVFPSNDCASRFILLMTCSDQNEDIRSLARKSLLDDSNNQYPNFFDLLKLVISNANGQYTIGTQQLVYHPKTYQEIIYYLHRCLIQENLHEKSTPLWKYEEQLIKIYDKVNNDQQNTVTVQWYNYIQLLLDYVVVVHDCLSTYYLFESILIAYHLKQNENLLKFCSDNLSSFRQLCLYSTRDDTRFYSSVMYAYIFAQQSDIQLDELFKYATNSHQRFEQREGAILALGYICSYLIYFRKQSLPIQEYIKRTKDYFLKTFISLTNDQQQYQLAIIVAIGQMARMRLFDETDEKYLSSIFDQFKRKISSINETNKLKEKSIQTLGYLSLCYKQHRKPIIDILIQSIIDTKQIELHLNIGDALVCCLLNDESPILSDPYLLLDEKQVIEIDDSKQREELIQYLFDHILHYSSDIDNPHSRQAALVWLLSFLIYCRRPYLDSEKYHRLLFEKYILELQKNLIYGLLDSDELNQELSSKCLIYSHEIIHNDQLRQKFNQNLFENFTDKSTSYSSARQTLTYEYDIKTKEEEDETNKKEKTNTTVTAPQTTLVVYKELCSIIQQQITNKAELFYSFLYLAHDNSIWQTSRYAHLFHFNEYETQAKDHILCHIDLIISKLYRLTFDPNPRVQTSIQRIWNKLFLSDDQQQKHKQQQIIDKYFAFIFKEIYEQLLSSRWRIRESCCSALLNLCRTHNRKLIDSYNYLKIFGELFHRLLLLCDDTKESVRKSALQTINTFKQNCLLTVCDTTVTTANSDETNPINDNKSRGQCVLEQILPILLKEGLYNKNEDIQKFCLNTIIEFVRSGDHQTLKPYCTLIITALFETLSQCEPDTFNTLSMKLSSNDMKEQIDIARILCAKASPMMDAIDLCTKNFVDETILDELSPKLIDTIKHNVGLTTKCCIGQYFVTLSTLYPSVCVKYVGKWMAAVVTSMSTNHNRTLRKTYSNVLGTIVRIAKPSSIENLFVKLCSWYFTIEQGQEYQYVCALTLNSIAQYNHDMLTEYGDKILPLIFLAMHQQKSRETENKLVNNDDDDDISATTNKEEKIWQDLWLEHTGSTASGIQKYINDIIKNIERAIGLTSYSMKIKGAKAIKTICDTLKSSLKEEHVELLVDVVLKALYGRIYEGKENFLRAIESMCSNCKIVLKTRVDLVNRIYEQILKECKKEALPYRTVAIELLASLADDYQFNVYALFWTWFEKAFKQELNDDGSINDKEDEEDPLISDKYNRMLIESIPKFWPKDNDQKRTYFLLTFDLLSDLLNKSTWQNQIIIIQSLNKLLLICSNDQYSIDEHYFRDHRLIEQVCNLGPRTKYTTLKRETIKFLSIIFELYQSYLNDTICDCIRFNLDEMIHEKNYHDISEQAKELKKKYEHLLVVKTIKIEPITNETDYDEKMEFETNDNFQDHFN
ncbi:unnamed protein product [Didymodactylos carnosus]|uniref:Uncharacterized protein n=1 Tax=Didymodactylos carnosus TaxID=1234261 RepID=A0A8S2CNT3_9BILA|nr:unnamed protein product [Didymodactylos carnosus]CAF3505256.1 unnamed protein product [Didymodactylos carnosus]